MRKKKKCLAYLMSAALIAGTLFGTTGSMKVSAVTTPDIPGENTDMNSIGATMPYTRYDSTVATVGGGASLVSSKDFSKDNLASQASEQSYINLPSNGSYAEWTMSTTGDGITMRYTLPDTDDGMGQDGSLDVYVNGVKVKTVDLTSYYMWQYFQYPNPYQNGHPDDKLEKVGSTGCFAFDEVHFKLDTSLKAGDKIRIQSSGANNLVYGVDFLETEDVPAPIAKPDDALSIVDYGAIPNDGKNDKTAILKCVTDAKAKGKDVYFPEGTFDIGSMWKLDASNIKITGAGIWYTNLQFTSAAQSGGGISGAKANNVEFCNMYINSMLRSRYEENAVYKCFMDVWSGDSYIHDIWEDHFECGFWLADYYFGDGEDYSDGLVIANSRIRNNFADGVNFCQGTSNATVYNCSIRNNGDDGLAMWNNNWNVKDEENNVFCYNTIDLIWRAGAIAVYGGNGHKIYNNYIADTFMASGIHLNTSFPGYQFNNNKDGITLSNNIIVRSGTVSDSWQGDMGAVDLTGSVKNITFNNTYIYDSQHDAVRVATNPSNLVFNNLKVYGTGKDGQTKSGENGALFKFASASATPTITVNGLEYANIAYSGVTYGKLTKCTIGNENNLGAGYNYSIPVGTAKIAINAPSESTTPEPITTPEPTTKVEATTTSSQAVTTKVLEKVKAPSKAKIKKITTKKKSSKKLKLSIKKISGVKGYQVAVYQTKKNATKNKKAIFKKFVKKTSVTVQSKKFKNKKTLYVKVRAYKLDGKTKVYGKWSTSKKVKIKK